MGHVGRTAVEIAADVRAGIVAAEDVVREHLDHIAAADGRIGAFQIVRGERAIADAMAIDRHPRRDELPLAGVPIAVKDNVAVAGEPMRVGSPTTPTRPQVDNHPVVQRLRDAGAVVVGLTRTPEFAVWPFTDGPLGTTRNPWDLSRTAGGSSGGSAAAVAAGLVPLAHGNDGMGSIRIPAACCGVLGLKPGLGLVPASIGADDWTGMAENGPLAATAADAALGLAVMAGDPDLADIERAPRLRIALSTSPPVPGVRIDPAWERAARDVADVLARQGHHVVEAEPPLPLWAIRAAAARWFAGLADDAAATGAGIAALQRHNRTHARLGRLAKRVGWVRRHDTERWRAALAPFMARYDVLLTPALAGPPPAAAPWASRSWPANYWAAARYTGGFHGPWNLAGWPSVALPAGLHSSGLPLAAQLTTGAGGESLLLALAAAVERDRPWPRRPAQPGTLGRYQPN